MEINIRRADVNDAELISSLSAITFSDTFTGTCTAQDMVQFVRENFHPVQVLKELQDRSDFYFIAFINQEAVGYLRLKKEPSEVPFINKYNAIELKRLYVLKEYLAKKVGATLMKFALDFAQENSFEAIWLGVWEQNERAKSFYRKWGFKDTGFTHPFPIGDTPQTDQWFIKVFGDEPFLKI